MAVVHSSRVLENMCNWAMKIAAACEPVLSLLQKEIRSGPLINIDETTVQVINELGRAASTKSYMWVCRRGSPGHPGLIFHYAPSPTFEVAKILLGKAIIYTLKQWHRLLVYLDHASMTPETTWWKMPSAPLW
ncbi:MAG: hypothetical protein ACI8PB_002497 [Desulforhopalus sp.]